MRNCLFCGIDISEAHGRAKYCSPSHRVQHVNGLVFDPNKKSKRGRPPSKKDDLDIATKKEKSEKRKRGPDKPKNDKVVLSDAPIEEMAVLQPKSLNLDIVDVIEDAAEPIIEETPPKEETVQAKIAPYALHPSWPFDFKNDNNLLLTEKYSIYPMTKRPAEQKARKEYDRLKKASDQLIRDAWADFKKPKK